MQWIIHVMPHTGCCFAQKGDDEDEDDDEDEYMGRGIPKRSKLRRKTVMNEELQEELRGLQDEDYQEEVMRREQEVAQQRAREAKRAAVAAGADAAAAAEEDEMEEAPARRGAMDDFLVDDVEAEVSSSPTLASFFPSPLMGCVIACLPHRTSCKKN